MKSRPIHRWKTLWFGLLILAFLGWAWARSTTDEFFISGRVASINIVVGQGYHTLNLRVQRFSHLTGVAFGTSSGPPNPSFSPSPQAITLESSNGFLLFGIAHWFLILLFLIPWSAFLFRRHRRLNRLAARQC